MRNVSTPTRLTAVPSENSPTSSSSHDRPGGERAHHRVGVRDLDADHLDARAHGLDVRRDPRDQSPATDRHEDGIELALVLAQDLHGDRALPGDDVGVVERVHERRGPVAAWISSAWRYASE